MRAWLTSDKPTVMAALAGRWAGRFAAGFSGRCGCSSGREARQLRAGYQDHRAVSSKLCQDTPPHSCQSQRGKPNARLLAQLDGLKEEVVGGNIDKFRQQACDVILGGIASAFDVSKEHPSVLARYDTSMIKIPADVLKKRDKIKGIEPVALGKQMLLARRLCEAGCGFVTVQIAGWDMHSNGASFGMDDGLPVLGAAVDKAVSAFIEDVEQRGLADKILLVITGDFGRTPKINDKGGRDHWGNLCTLALAGGGLKMGQVIGGSDSKASAPASDPLTPTHLMATILHTLFDPGQLRLQPKAATVNAMLSNAEPIRQLF
jgi:hypothetical protein